MALPPTYIYDYIFDSPEYTFDRLRKAGFLNKSALKQKGKFVKELEYIKKEYLDSRSLATGPNLTDLFAHASRPFLNKAGIKLADTDFYRSTFLEKVNILFVKVISRIKNL